MFKVKTYNPNCRVHRDGWSHDGVRSIVVVHEEWSGQDGVYVDGVLRGVAGNEEALIAASLTRYSPRAPFRLEHRIVESLNTDGDSWPKSLAVLMSATENTGAPDDH